MSMRNLFLINSLHCTDAVDIFFFRLHGRKPSAEM
jgi:hypothetical protein